MSGGNYTCTSSSSIGKGGIWNVYARSSPDGNANWSAEVSMIQATPYGDYLTADGFDHPYGDYTETTTDGAGTFSGGESTSGSGDVYFSKF